MQFRTTFLIAALGLANQGLACVQFSAEANEYNFLSGNLQDNGGTPCTVNSYGDNNGWGFSCWSGWSAYLNFNGVVDYTTPGGSYSFATDDTENCGLDSGCITVYSASVFGC